MKNRKQINKRIKFLRQNRSHHPTEMYKKLCNANNRSSLKITRETLFTVNEFKEWFKRQKLICYYCELDINQFNKIKKKLSGHSPNSYRFGFDRKDSNRGYYLNNIVLCCANCNHIKGYIFSADEFKEICSSYIKPKLLGLLNER